MTDTENFLSQIDSEIAELEGAVLERFSSDRPQRAKKHKSLNVGEDKGKIDCYAQGRALYERGTVMSNDEKYMKEAYRLFLLGVDEADDPKCLYGIGLCLFHGYGAGQDQTLGKRILSEAQKRIDTIKGDSEAFVILYEYNRYGYCCPVDKGKALSRLEKANCPRADFLRAREVTNKDPVSFLLKAYKAGFPLAYNALGSIYRYGSYLDKSSSVTKNIAKAKEYFKKGAELGYEDCKRSLTELSYMDRGFEISDGILIRYTAKSKEVYLPDIVTGIEQGAFYDADIKTLHLPDAMTEVPINAFKKDAIPEIKGKSFDKIKHAKALRSLKPKINIKKDNPYLYGNIIVLCVFVAIALILPVTRLVKFNLAGTVPSIIYGVGALAAITLSVILSFKHTDPKVLFLTVPAFCLFAGAFLFGGYVPDKWCFIPIASIAFIISGVISLYFSSTISFAAIGIPILAGGLTTIFGGVLSGAFIWNTPHVVLIVIYGIVCAMAIVAFIGDFASMELNPVVIPSTPSFLVAAVGVCFSGAYVWWIHAILLMASITGVSLMFSFLDA